MMAFIMLPLEREDISGIQEVFKKYDDQGVELADAALVHLANREQIRIVFTLDRRHFSVYRLQSGDTLRMLPESLE